MAAVCVSQKSGRFSGKAVVFKGQLSPGGHIPHRAQLSAEARADTSDVYWYSRVEMLKLTGAAVRSTARKWPPAKPWKTQKLGYAYTKDRTLRSNHLLEHCLSCTLQFMQAVTMSIFVCSCGTPCMGACWLLPVQSSPMYTNQNQIYVQVLHEATYSTLFDKDKQIRIFWPQF